MCVVESYVRLLFPYGGFMNKFNKTLLAILLGTFVAGQADLSAMQTRSKAKAAKPAAKAKGKTAKGKKAKGQSACATIGSYLNPMAYKAVKKQAKAARRYVRSCTPDVVANFASAAYDLVPSMPGMPGLPSMKTVGATAATSAAATAVLTFAIPAAPIYGTALVGTALGTATVAGVKALVKTGKVAVKSANALANAALNRAELAVIERQFKRMTPAQEAEYLAGIREGVGSDADSDAE